MILQLNTEDSVADLIDAHTMLGAVIARRRGERIDRDIAAGIAGKPLNLKEGAPENKLAHLTETKDAGMQEGLPFHPANVPQTVEQQLAAAKSASMMAPAEIAEAAIQKAAEPEKPKRTRAPKPEVVKTVTVDEVRALMVSLSSKGPEEQSRQRQILTDMGYEKLSVVPPEKLVDLMAKIREGMN